MAASSLGLRMTNGKEADLPGLVGMLNDPDMVFDTTPKGSMKYAEFMHGVGTIRTKPVSWKDFFFPNTHNLPGSRAGAPLWQRGIVARAHSIRGR